MLKITKTPLMKKEKGGARHYLGEMTGKTMQLRGNDGQDSVQEEVIPACLGKIMTLVIELAR